MEETKDKKMSPSWSTFAPGEDFFSLICSLYTRFKNYLKATRAK